MVHYKLTYFDGRGAAEIIRQIFVLAGQEYEDIRLSHDEWPKYKNEMPFGQLPVLEVDGKKLAQSFAIARFVAKKFGFAGKCPFEEALVDSITDQYKDFINEIRPFLRVAMGFAEGDVEKLSNEVFLPAREKFFGFMTNFLKESKSGKFQYEIHNYSFTCCYLVGDSLTFADLYLAECASEFAKKTPTIFDGFPEIKAHAEKVRSNPALKKWIETRPETKF
ncbi:glutathione S-transferase protein [Necator americanus]|uniref:glutathione transferase n=1 Tax=Necator americanus TaxID=51031 RepID=W2TFW0_NECAM|nr:glutathione S-transferase protein [Necator americanus]ETN80925.1 glutathione S-transferase protein [Necator americanus]